VLRQWQYIKYLLLNFELTVWPTGKKRVFFGFVFCVLFEYRTFDLFCRTCAFHVCLLSFVLIVNSCQIESQPNSAFSHHGCNSPCFRGIFVSAHHLCVGFFHSRRTELLPPLEYILDVPRPIKEIRMQPLVSVWKEGLGWYLLTK
jgi:hypothetical protein